MKKKAIINRHLNKLSLLKIVKIRTFPLLQPAGDLVSIDFLNRPSSEHVFRQSS